MTNIYKNSIVSMPAPGVTELVRLIPGESIHFGFDEDGAAISRAGSSLVMTLENGGVVVVEDYFATIEHSLPKFILEDGAEVPGAEFLKLMNPNLDISPAAGPESHSEGSGVGNYADAAGNLIDGVSAMSAAVDTADLDDAGFRAGGVSGSFLHYGAMGFSQTPFATTAESGSFGARPEISGGNASGGVGNDKSEAGSGAGDTGGDLQQPQAPVNAYIRAVLHTDGLSGATVGTPVLLVSADGQATALDAADINIGGSNAGARYTVSVSVPEGWDASWVNYAVNAETGRVEVSLSPAGMLELQSLGDTFLVDVLRVNVTDTLHGTQQGYTIEIVAGNGAYDAAVQGAQEETLTQGAVGGDMMLLGEYHQSDGGRLDIVASGLGDEITVSGSVTEGSIVSSGNANITINGLLDAASGTNSVDVGAGMLTLHTSLQASDLVADNSHLFQIGGAVTAHSTDGGGNVINAGSLDVSLDAAALSDGVYSMVGGVVGSNDIQVSGDAHVAISGNAMMLSGLYGQDDFAGPLMFAANGQTDIAVTGNQMATGIYGNVHASTGALSMTIVSHGIYGSVGVGGGAVVVADDVSLSVQALNNASAFGAAGMHASPGQQSILESSTGHALNLTINALAEGNTPTYAMYISAGGVNSIIGHSQTGGVGDSVVLNGDVYSVNTAGAMNTISTGAGDDVIVLNGTVTGHLIVDGGLGDDILLLQAASAEEFVNRYGSWLNGLTESQLTGIERIEMTGDYASTLESSLPQFFQFISDHNITLDYQREVTSLEGLGNVDASVHYTSVFDGSQDLGEHSLVFGAGRDSLIFHDGVHNGSLNLGGGSDTVTLEGGLSNAQIDLGSGNDHAYLSGSLWISGSSLAGGDGIDTLHLDGLEAMNGNAVSLSGLAQNQVSGFEVIDMSGAHADTLSIDALLASVSGADHLTIRGDAQDTLNLQGVWAKGNAVMDAGVTYDTYTNHEGESLLVQQSIIVNSGV